VIAGQLQKSTINNKKINNPMSKASDLEERLINFSVTVFTQTKNIANTRDYRSLVDQVRRSATSPALNYGEAQSAESTNDFIHKLGIVVKELRETYNALRILSKLGCIPPEHGVLSECNDLIAIFVASVKTAQRNRK
jgi:four helix bundle protein